MHALFYFIAGSRSPPFLQRLICGELASSARTVRTSQHFVKMSSPIPLSMLLPMFCTTYEQ